MATPKFVEGDIVAGTTRSVVTEELWLVVRVKGPDYAGDLRKTWGSLVLCKWEKGLATNPTVLMSRPPEFYRLVEKATTNTIGSASAVGAHP